MKISLKSLLIMAVVSMTALCAHAVETASEVVVLKVTGAPMASTNNMTPVAIKVGDKLPQGAVITTADKTEVAFKTFAGTTTTIKPNSQATLSKLTLTTEGGAITKQTALIDLTAGSVVSSLDHTKRSINDYSIRTPRGVAAARGTQYTVTVTTDGKTVIQVLEGTVTVTGKDGTQVQVTKGSQVVLDENGKPGTPTDIPSGEKPSTEKTYTDETYKNTDNTLTVSPSNP